MKKLILSGVVLFSTLFAFAFVAPSEHYCKHDAQRDIGVCAISSNGTAICWEVSGGTTNKDCYGVNND